MNKLLLTTCLIAVLFTVKGQRQLSLESVVDLAIQQSTAAKEADTRKENRYWQYRTFKADFYPTLQLEGTLPNFNRAVRRILQDDGSYNYRFQNQNLFETELFLNQTIPFTGGRVFISSSLSRFDDFVGKFNTYGGDPVTVGIVQPLFGFNPYKWQRQIEPLRYEESRREYVEEYELISGISAAYFFEFLTAQITLSIALKNVDSNDTLYQIARGRYDLGKIPESDLLNLELQLMRSQQDVAQAELNLETARLRLKSYLGLNQEESIELITPSEIPEFEVSEELAVEMARKNRSDAIAFKRRMMEADRDVAQAVGGSGLNGRVFSRFGLTNQGDNIGNVYVNPNSQLVADVGLSIPILDWGRQKAVKKTALANQQLARYTLEQEEINFEQEVITHVKRFKMLRNQVTISKKADLVSQKRYDVTKSRYLIGKMEITDLSLALTEKDRAKQTYLTSLGDFWQAYYVLRQLTLYDFATRRLLYDPTQE